jgi:Fe-S cluster assembly protein SufB
MSRGGIGATIGQQQAPNPVQFTMRAPKGLSEKTVRDISAAKGEPDWMLAKRLEAWRLFLQKPMPNWGPDLSDLNFDELTPFVRATDKKARKWEDVPKYIKDTFDKLGIPESERKFLSGAGAMYESEVIYRNINKQLSEIGVIFTDMDSALREYPEMVKKHFMNKCVPAADNKFSALHGAFWSGGSFVYVPKGVRVPMPLQIYFLMNHPAFGQFEHTIIIAEEGSTVSYIEGCSAPLYDTNSLHSAVVEIFAHKNSRVRYTSIQNWSKNVYNLNTKRALVYEDAFMEWVGGTLGSKMTMLYPCSVLLGRGARADHLNIAYAGKGQVKDGGAKVIHAAPYTTSTINAKSICRDGGFAAYRGLLRVNKGCVGCKSSVRCDALLLDKSAKSATYPHMEINENHVTVAHEARVGRISDTDLFYLQSRGISEPEAMAMIVRGFMEPITKALPMEYAVELNKMIELEMEGPGHVG